MKTLKQAAVVRRVSRPWLDVGRQALLLKTLQKHPEAIQAIYGCRVSRLTPFTFYVLCALPIALSDYRFGCELDTKTGERRVVHKTDFVFRAFGFHAYAKLALSRARTGQVSVSL